ncbi:hypothetical protein QKC54_gp0194 [Megavirus baoshan]|uniref:Uncharacterized protein n=1 Tax=Megavirus baoshan TaxID=2496520 RepID=A0A3S5HLE5_9VIRU|nr:hypothetical protein QKC54_gp0194 [Megavirus baoshan]AZL89728.1 hypothetical protein Mb0878 [Megavirus baoshan]
MLSAYGNNTCITIPSLASIIFEKMKEHTVFLTRVQKYHGSLIDFKSTQREYEFVHKMNAARAIIDSIEIFNKCCEYISAGGNPTCQAEIKLSEYFTINPKYNKVFIYGGFLRDYIAGDIYSDIDIKFDSKKLIKIFIDYYIPKQYIKQILPTSLNNNASRYYCKCITINLILPGYLNYPIVIDLTYTNKVYFMSDIIHSNSDFDVNKLRLDNNIVSNLTTYHINCQVDDILENCRNKQFIVMSLHEYPKIKHQKITTKYIYDANGNIIDIEHPNEIEFHLDCINRYNYVGKILLQRIAKMQSKGWYYRNEPCDNPWCILAPPELSNKYYHYMKNYKGIDLSDTKSRNYETDLRGNIIIDNNQLEEFISDDEDLHIDIKSTAYSSYITKKKIPIQNKI